MHCIPTGNTSNMYKCRYFQCPYVHRFVYELFISSVYLFVYPCVITVLIVLAPPPFADDVAFIPLSVLSLFLSFLFIVILE